MIQPRRMTATRFILYTLLVSPCFDKFLKTLTSYYQEVSGPPISYDEAELARWTKIQESDDTEDSMHAPIDAAALC